MKKDLLFGLSFLFIFCINFSCRKTPQDFSTVPSKWTIASQKIVQRIEDDITDNLHKNFSRNLSFNDIEPEPDLQFAQMGSDNEPILTVTLIPFKSQDGAEVFVYRLGETESQLIQEFNCMTKDGCEIIPIHGDRALLIHDEERKNGNGCLYFVRAGKLEKVFEYPDTDYGYQLGFTYQTKLTVEDNRLYLYRWNSPDGQRTDDDLKGNVPSSKVEVVWDEKTGAFKQGRVDP